MTASEEPEVVAIARDGPEMAAAIQEARETVQEFIGQLHTIGDHRYLVKMRVVEGDVAEHM